MILFSILCSGEYQELLVISTTKISNSLMPFVHYITLPLLHVMMLTVLRGRRGTGQVIH